MQNRGRACLRQHLAVQRRSRAAKMRPRRALKPPKKRPRAAQKRLKRPRGAQDTPKTRPEPSKIEFGRLQGTSGMQSSQGAASESLHNRFLAISVPRAERPTCKKPEKTDEKLQFLRMLSFCGLQARGHPKTFKIEF